MLELCRFYGTVCCVVLHPFAPSCAFSTLLRGCCRLPRLTTPACLQRQAHEAPQIDFLQGAPWQGCAPEMQVSALSELCRVSSSLRFAWRGGHRRWELQGTTLLRELFLRQEKLYPAPPTNSTRQTPTASPSSSIVVVVVVLLIRLLRVLLAGRILLFLVVLLSAGRHHDVWDVIVVLVVLVRWSKPAVGGEGCRLGYCAEPRRQGVAAITAWRLRGRQAAQELLREQKLRINAQWNGDGVERDTMLGILRVQTKAASWKTHTGSQALMNNPITITESPRGWRCNCCFEQFSNEKAQFTG